MKPFNMSKLHYVHGLIETCTDMAKVSKLLQQRYTFLGSGAYASVFDLGDYVLKVGDSLDDDGYSDFVKYCGSTPEYSDVLPEIIYHKDFPGMNGFITVLPKYEELDCGTKYWYLHDTFHSLYEYTDLQDITLARLRHEINTSAFSYANNYGGHTNEFRRVVREHVNLYKAIHELAEIADDNGLAFDIHSGNFMINRNTNKLIITDPWCR